MKPSRTPLQLFLLVFLCVYSAQFLRAQQDTNKFLESFAFASDRDGMLKQLTPGTERYYFFHAVYYQTSGQIEKAREFINEWARHKDLVHEDVFESARIRQAILDYPNQPDASMEIFREYLGIRALQDKQNAHTLGPSLSTNKSFALNVSELLLQVAKGFDLDGVETRSLFEVLPLLDRPKQIDELLERLDRVDVPNLPELISQQLSRSSQPFGKSNIHRELTLDQLQELVRLYPRVGTQDAFVRCYLKRLMPIADSTEDDRDRHRQYLQRVEDYVLSLSSIYDGLRACVLFHRLKEDQKDGIYERERFIRYLKIPKMSTYSKKPEALVISEAELGNRIINLEFEPSGYVPGISPIIDDTELVDDYLMHFFQTDDNPDSFRPWIDDRYLDETFAESKILYGVGDSKPHYEKLTVEVQEDVRHRSELRFAPGNQNAFEVEQHVRLNVWLKNIPSLDIRIYRLDGARVLRDLGSISTDIELEGIKPGSQRTLSYQTPSDRRYQVAIEFPELQGRGIWVVDFFGSGRRARALIQKGELNTIARMDAGGQVIRILNERGETETEGFVEVERQRYFPDADGNIRIPYDVDRLAEKMIVATKQLACIEPFDPNEPRLEFFEDFMLDAESLIAGKEASMWIRPSLFCNGEKLPLARLRNMKLKVRLGDVDGVDHEEVERVILSDVEATLFRFKVPVRLATIGFELVGEYEGEFGKYPVQAGRQVVVNPQQKLARVASFFLQASKQGYSLCLLGRNGEAYPNQRVKLRIKMRGLVYPVEQEAITDSHGVIELGTHARIESITTTTDLAGSQTMTLERMETGWPSCIYEVEGKSISLVANAVEGRYSLFELRDGFPYANRSTRIQEKPGTIFIDGLEEGDYLLRDHFREVRTKIRILKAKALGDWWQSPTQMIEKQHYSPSYLESVEQRDGKFLLNLKDYDAGTRVHVIGRVFQIAQPEGSLWPSRTSEPQHKEIITPRSLYVSNRRLGDEQQYVMDRAQQRHLPGNMLPAPSWLLRPWQNQESDGYIRELEEDDAMPDRKVSQRGPMADSDGEIDGGGGERVLADNICQFLREGSFCLSNLRANEHGTVVLDAVDLVGKSQLQIVVTHPNGVSYHSVLLDKVDVATLTGNDQRLRSHFSEAEHRCEKRVIETLKGGEWNQVGQAGNTRFRVISEIKDLFAYYTKTCGGDREDWELFRPITNWPEYSFEEKCKLYEKLACHELHLFLYHKDRDFFDRVVLPHLSNKLEKRFIDQWFLGSDLSKFAEPWQLASLNPVELVLLAQRMPTAKAQIEQLMRHQLEDPQNFRSLRRNLFGIAMVGRKEEFQGNLSLVVATGEIWSELGREYSLWAPMGDGFPAAGMGGMGGMGGGLEFEYQGPRLAVPGFLQEADDAQEEAEEKEDRSVRVNDESNEEAILAEELDASLRSNTHKSIEQFYPQANWKFSRTYRWRESAYYRPTGSWKIRFTSFWLDWLNHSSEKGPLLSEHLDWGPSDFSTAIIALATLDFPWENQYEWKVEAGNVWIRPQHDCVAFVQRTETVGTAKEAGQIGLAQQTFVYHPSESDSGLESDADQTEVSEHFSKGVPYQNRIVIMNPTDKEVQLDVLAQIPQGAIPLNGSEMTRSWYMIVPPFENLDVNVEFYFPENGEYSQYGAQVSNSNGAVASLPLKKYNVSPPSESRQFTNPIEILMYGSDEKVLEFLRQDTLANVSAEFFMQRLAKREFYESVVEIYSAKQKFEEQVWGFAFIHRDEKRMSEWFQHNRQLCVKLGPVLKSGLLEIDPSEYGIFEHNEFFPMVATRRFAIGKGLDIPNRDVRNTYLSFLTLLCYKQQLEPLDKLQIVSFMLLQNRIEEALKWFSEVSRDSVAVKLQYDYCDAYLAMYKKDYGRARSIAKEYRDYPLTRWRGLFAEVIAQLDERDALLAGRKTGDATTAQTSFELVEEGNRLVLHHNQSGSVSIDFFELDIEALFSRKPFEQQTGKSLAWGEPSASQVVSLEEATDPFVISIPEELRNANVLVQVTSRHGVSSKMLYANQLKVITNIEKGTLQVLHRETREPLDAVYIKVYGRDVFGEVEFYKDGYTDLRGAFDFVMQTTEGLREFREFAILIMHPKYGTRVIEL
jgi:hypothetical protein